MTAGVASDNLLFAGANGKGFQITRNRNCILIELLLFVLQTELMIWGSQFALMVSDCGTCGKISGLLVLFLTGITMIYRCFNQQWPEKYLMLSEQQMLVHALSTCMLVLSFSFAIGLLTGANSKFIVYLLAMLPLFITTGVLLGMFKRMAALKYLRLTGTLCFVLGLILLIIN